MLQILNYSFYHVEDLQAVKSKYNVVIESVRCGLQPEPLTLAGAFQEKWYH